jgi:adenosylhomocysteine nucleosidase
MKILFVAAVPREFEGMLSRASEVRPADVPVGFARRARLGGNEVLMAAGGMGWKQAARAAAAAEVFRPEVIVSTGFCGALDESLTLGDVVSATAVVGADTEYPAIPLGPRTGVIVSIDRVARTAVEKQELRKTGAFAVEMEAAAVARTAAERAIPFYCVRAVTDLAGESLANDFNRALREDGHLDTMIILRGALCRPTSRIPELFRLNRRCARAAEALGEFFVGCRF